LNSLPTQFYLFSFGANDEVNLAKHLYGKLTQPVDKKGINLIKAHTSPAFLPGYLRSFFGYSEKWQGSVGTLIKTNKCGDGTYGLITKITKDRNSNFFVGKRQANLKNLCKVENIDGGMYVFCQVTKLNGVPVYAFIGCIDQFKNNILPSKNYLNAVGQILERSFPNTKEIHIPIRMGEKKKIICTYHYHPSKR